LAFYAKEIKIGYPVLIGDGRAHAKSFYRPWIGFPATILIGRDSNICHSHSAYAPKEKSEAEILSRLSLKAK
jgi:hypothetical protein